MHKSTNRSAMTIVTVALILAGGALAPASADELIIRDQNGKFVGTITESPSGTYIRRGPVGDFKGTITPGPIPGDRATIRDPVGRATGTISPDGTIRDSSGRYKGSIRGGK